MTILAIPCQPGGQSHWVQTTSLGGQQYQLTFRWSQRAGRWTVDLADDTGSMIVAGRALAPLLRLLKGVRDPRRPPGEIVLVDQRAAREGLADPSFTSLGERHQLVYLDGDDLTQALAVLP
jgi:hypothetical protein